MNTMPLMLSAGQRASLMRFEQLHAEWCEATRAAEACACDAARSGPDWLHQVAAAERLHREAMRLLREQPL